MALASFITLSDSDANNTKIIVNVNSIHYYSKHHSGSSILAISDRLIFVKETPEEISKILNENYCYVKDRYESAQPSTQPEHADCAPSDAGSSGEETQGS